MIQPQCSVTRRYRQCLSRAPEMRGVGAAPQIYDATRSHYFAPAPWTFGELYLITLLLPLLQR